MVARSVQEVIAALDRIVDEARERQRRAGYFAALYRKTTLKIEAGIRAGLFDDGARMESLDVIFANRYLQAAEQYQRGDPPTRSWLVAFQAADSRWPIVLQHLLLGMNAHINLDLGIAAAETCPGSQLAGLRSDFLRVNAILASLLGEVKQELAQIWPLASLLDRIAGSTDDVVVNFSMRKAREYAWSFAERLAPMGAAERPAEIAAVDRWTAAFGRVVRNPPSYLARAALLLVRVGERGRVPQIIDILV